MAAVVEDLDHGDRTVGYVDVAAELVASTSSDAVGDLLPVADDAARHMPAAPERIVAPGEQHTLLLVLHQEIDVHRRDDLVDEPKQRPRQNCALSVQLRQKAFERPQFLSGDRFLVRGRHHSLPFATPSAHLGKPIGRMVFRDRSSRVWVAGLYAPGPPWFGNRLVGIDHGKSPTGAWRSPTDMSFRRRVDHVDRFVLGMAL